MVSGVVVAVVINTVCVFMAEYLLLENILEVIWELLIASWVLIVTVEVYHNWLGVFVRVFFLVVVVFFLVVVFLVVRLVVRLVIRLMFRLRIRIVVVVVIVVIVMAVAGSIIMVPVVIVVKVSIRWSVVMAAVMVMSIAMVVLGSPKSSVAEWLHHTIVSITISVGDIISEVLSELVELVVADWLDFAQHGPQDALSARRSGQRAIIGPVVLSVNGLEEFSERDVTEVGTFLGGTVEIEGINEFVLVVSSLLSVEHDTNDCSKISLSVLVLMDDM